MTNKETTETTRPGRKRKFSLDEVRQRMVDVSVNELLDEGVGFGVDQVRIDRMLMLAEVPRGSAYAAWEDQERTPQESLRRATILHVLKTTTANNAGPTRDYALSQVAVLADEINSGDLERKRRARAEIIRTVAHFNNERLNSKMWRLYRTLVRATTTQAVPDPDMLAAIEEGEQRLIDSYTDLFREFAELFAMVLKPGRSLRQFAMAMVALNDGLSNHSSEVFRADNQLSTDADGNVWNLFGLASEGLLDAFFELTTS